MAEFLNKVSAMMGRAQVPLMEATEVSDQLEKLKIVDVRRPEEWVGELGHIAGAAFSTLETEFESDLLKWPKDQTYVFVCRSGARSGRATEAALAAGFKNVFNMAGGMIAWNEAHLPVERKGRN